MKRFFKPIEKETANKRPSTGPVAGDGDVVGESGGESASGDQKKEPLKFLTWNANSFLLRVKNNWPEFTKFVQRVDPDAIAIQVSFCCCCCCFNMRI